MRWQDFKKNTYLIKTLIFNENISFAQCFAIKLPLQPSPRVCIPDLEVLHTSDFTYPHTTQVSRIISNFWTVTRAAPDPWLATTPGQPEHVSVTVLGEHMQSTQGAATALLPALWVLQHPLESKVSAPSTRDDSSANPGTFNNLTTSEIKFQFGYGVVLQFYPACSLVKRKTACVKSSSCKKKVCKLSFLVSSIWYFLKKTRLCSILQY